MKNSSVFKHTPFRFNSAQRFERRNVTMAVICDMYAKTNAHMHTYSLKNSTVLKISKPNKLLTELHEIDIHHIDCFRTTVSS